MIDKRFLDDISSRIDEALRASPAQDVEKNLKAMLAAWFDRLDLVLREDFDVQKQLLERAQAKLAELDANPSQPRVRILGAPISGERVTEAQKGRGYLVNATARQATVIVDRRTDIPGDHMHIQTSYGEL